MLVFHPPGETHCQSHDATVASLNVEIGPHWLKRIADFAGPLDQAAEFRGDEIASAGLQMVPAFQRGDDPDAPLAIESLCWEILAASQQRKPATVQRGRPRWLLEARELLDSHQGARRQVAMGFMETMHGGVRQFGHGGSGPGQSGDLTIFRASGYVSSSWPTSTRPSPS